MRAIFLTLTFITFFTVSSLCQSKALTFQEAEKQGIPFQHLDSLYKSAVHSDTNLAVFKTAEEQTKLQQAYVKLLHDLGIFLKANDFKWEKQTRGANRIYFKPDGRIDYFLFHFPGDQLTPGREKEFTRLLNQFIRDYRFTITATEKFAQCSAVKYSDN